MSVTRVLIFLAVVLSVTGAVHYYLWARLVRDAGWPPGVSRALTLALVALAASMPAAMMLMRVLARPLASPLVWVAMVWMGAMFLLFVLLLPADAVRAIAGWVDQARNLPPDPERRRFVARAMAAVVGAGAAAGTAVGMTTALRSVAVKHVRVPTPRLPAAFHGMTVVQLTDVHVGPTIGKAFIDEVVAKVNALAPDIVAITGDLVDGSVEELGPFVAPLGAIKARHGVYFVTGNHEYYSGADAWIAFLSGLGIKVLRNERITVERDGARLDVAGVDDWTAHQFGGGHGADLAKALAGRDVSRALLLLAHQPKAVLEAAKHGVSLQLSGHTHGGQIFPFNFLVRLQQPYVAGLHDHEGTRLYVSNGTGYWGPPLRVGIPAEITRLELVGV